MFAKKIVKMHSVACQLVSEPGSRRFVLKFFVLGPPNNFFFLENALKKVLNIFSNFFFHLKVQSLRFIMENNFIQIAVSAGHAVVYTRWPNDISPAADNAVFKKQDAKH